MANRGSDERHIRKLGKTGGGKTYMLTVPIEYVRQLGWKEGQKLSVLIDDDRLVVSDYRKARKQSQKA